MLMQLIVLALITYGSIRMYRLRSYRAAQMASILACVPLLSPFFVLGIPVGFWALKRLQPRAVRAAFWSADAAKSGGPL